MIKRISVENFQILKDVDIELSPGINAITGSSRQGKSSFMRSLIFWLFNKPTGDHFINWYAKHCCVKGELEPGGVIERYRDSTSNYYDLNGTVMKAMRGSVPDEVLSVTQITDDNVQHQLFNNIFMLNDTPGTVSAKFNEVGGLDDIDETLSNLNGMHKKTMMEKDQQKNLIDEYNTALEAYTDVDTMEKRLSWLETQMEEIEGYDASIEYIDEQVKKIEAHTQRMQTLAEFLECEKDAQSINGLAQTAKEMDAQLIKLQKYIKTLESHNESLEQSKELLDLEPKIKKLHTEAKTVQDSTRNIDALHTRLERLEAASRQRNQLEKQLSAKQKAFNELTAEIKFCPICKKPMAEGVEHDTRCL